MEINYFQVQSIRCETNALVSGKSGVAFKFEVIPGGRKKDLFEIAVLYPLEWFTSDVGKGLVKGGPFLTDAGKEKLMHLSFHILRKRFNETSLKNRDTIVVDAGLVNQLSIVIQKQCEFLSSNGRDWFCLGADEQLLLLPALCEGCPFPEPVSRCENMKLHNMTGEFDDGGILQLEAKCYCLISNTLPALLNECANRTCFVPHRFHLRQLRHRLGFQFSRQGTNWR